MGAKLELSCEIVETCTGISRMELMATVCDLLDLRRPNVGLKTNECRRFLEEVQEQECLGLPARQATHLRDRRTTVPVRRSARTC